MRQAYVGRQPIYERTRKVVGYELLFRPGDVAPLLSGEEMTSRVMVHTCIDFGLRNIVGDKAAYVNMTRPFLVGDLPVPFPRENTVLEVLEDIVADDEVIAGIERFQGMGYRIALDDFAFAEHNTALLEIADIVKIDISAWEVTELPELVEKCRAAHCRVVAERVETPQQLDACLRAGFDMFQGFALSRPEVVTSTAFDASRMHCLELMARLSQPDIPLAEVDALVRRDPGLVYRVLRAANSAAVALSRPIRTVREAVILLGLRQLQSWVTILVAAKMDGEINDQSQDLVTRAKMCELLAKRVPQVSPDAAFAMGVVSKLDVVLGVPVEEVVLQLPLHRDIVAAVLDRTGPLGRILDCAEAYETDSRLDLVWAPLRKLPLADMYLSALSWSFSVCEQVA